MATETLAIPAAASCKKCGYVLRGLCDPRCPECGNPFDLYDPTTYTVRQPRRFLNNRWKLLTSCSVLGVVGNLFLDIPLRFLVIFPSIFWSDSLFQRHRSVWLLLTGGAFVLVLAHPVHPNRVTACLTVVSSIAWYLLAVATFVLVWSASV